MAGLGGLNLTNYNKNPILTSNSLEGGKVKKLTNCNLLLWAFIYWFALKDIILS